MKWSVSSPVAMTPLRAFVSSLLFSSIMNVDDYLTRYAAQFKSLITELTNYSVNPKGWRDGLAVGVRTPLAGDLSSVPRTHVRWLL